MEIATDSLYKLKLTRGVFVTSMMGRSPSASTWRPPSRGKIALIQPTETATYFMVVEGLYLRFSQSLRVERAGALTEKEDPTFLKEGEYILWRARNSDRCNEKVGKAANRKYAN
jgi:hypothetical protein